MDKQKNFWILSKEEMFSGSWVMQSAGLRNVYFKMVEVEKKGHREKEINDAGETGD